MIDEIDVGLPFFCGLMAAAAEETRAVARGANEGCRAKLSGCMGGYGEVEGGPRSKQRNPTARRHIHTSACTEPLQSLWWPLAHLNE